jgi:hypothetical protein
MLYKIWTGGATRQHHREATVGMLQLPQFVGYVVLEMSGIPPQRPISSKVTFIMVQFYNFVGCIALDMWGLRKRKQSSNEKEQCFTCLQTHTDYSSPTELLVMLHWICWVYHPGGIFSKATGDGIRWLQALSRLCFGYYLNWTHYTFLLSNNLSQAKNFQLSSTCVPAPNPLHKRPPPLHFPVPVGSLSACVAPARVLKRL